MTREKSVRKNHSWQPVENWAHYHDYSPPLCIPHFPNRILDGKCKSKLNKTQIIKNQLQGQTRVFFGKAWVKGVAKEEAGGREGVMSSLARVRPQGIAGCGLATYSINYQGLTPTTMLHSIIRYLGQRTTTILFNGRAQTLSPPPVIGDFPKWKHCTQDFPGVDNLLKNNKT